MRKYVENFEYFSNKDQASKENNFGINKDALLLSSDNLQSDQVNKNILFQDNFTLQKFIEEARSNGNKFELGVCVHAVDYLFNQISLQNNLKVFQIKISYLEIYNEQVIDLLVEKSPALMIVEDAQKGVLVPDLSEFVVNNSSELIQLIIEGNQRRTMAATGQNQFSSRSHAILQILVEQRSKIKDIKEEYLVSKFLLVDLAGSERGGLEKGIRTHEGKNINKSLLSLGNCINILSDKSKKGAFVPYRDSKLTRLLKDSLGGNIMTVMIACVSPAAISYDETVNTLKYAMRARKIEKKITKNVKEVDVHISQYKEIIDSLKTEIEQLKQIIKDQQQIIHKGTIHNEINDDFIRKSADEDLYFKSDLKHVSKSSEKTKHNYSEKKKNEVFNLEKGEELDELSIEKKNVDINQSKRLNKPSTNDVNDSYKINLNSTNNNDKKSNRCTNEKENNILSLRNSTESLDVINCNDIKNFNSEDNLNAISREPLNLREDKNNLKQSSSKKFNSSNNLKFNQAPNFNSNRDISVHSKGEHYQKITYESLHKKRTYTQKYLNESKNRINISKRLFSDHQENRNNISSPVSINVKDFDIHSYRSFLNKSGDEDFNIDELEKHVENLNNDKIFIEELLEKGKTTNSLVAEKYKIIKNCYEKYLDYINEKLIQNIEESMILKFNLKEILDLNLANHNNINILTNQITNLEKIIQENNAENITSIEEEISKLKEEIANVDNAIVENDNLKEKIADSLKKNLRFKTFLKKILLKLISKSQKKETNLEEAYIKIIKEKEDLEKKNKTFEKHLSSILKDKHIKESKLDKIEDELNRLKKVIAEKDKQIKNIQSLNNVKKYSNNYSKNKLSQSRGREMSKNNNNTSSTNNFKKVRSSISLDKNNLKNNVKTKIESKKILNTHIKNNGKKDILLSNNFTNSINNLYEENLTEQDKIEINLQDDYVGTKKRFINDINPLSDNNSNFIKENNIKTDVLETNSIKNVAADKADDFKIEIDLQNIIYNKNANLINNQASIQNIKYIINQTNNIVNNNINKIIEKDNNNKKMISSKNSYNSINKITSNKNKNNNNNNNNNSKKDLNLRESYKEKIKEAMNLNSKELQAVKKNRMNSLHKSGKKNSIISNNVLDFYDEKILKTNNAENFNGKDSIKMNDINMNIYRSPRNKLTEEKPTAQSNNLKNHHSRKLKEYDKIIENQLNEVYNKKAKEIGEKMKRKIKSSNYTRNNNTHGKINPNNIDNNNNKMLEDLNLDKNDTMNLKEFSQNHPNLNKSLSISCVSVNQEIGFCSELDIVDQINDKDLLVNKDNNNKNKIYVKKVKPDSNALLNNKLFNKNHKKISIIKLNNNSNISPNQITKCNNQINSQPYSENNIREHLFKKDSEKRILENEFRINEENIIKVVNLRDENIVKDQLATGFFSFDPNDPSLANKKPNINIDPIPIKIDTNFVNNFINTKKNKPIDYNSSNNLTKHAEKYINFPKNNESKNDDYFCQPLLNLEENIRNINIYVENINIPKNNGDNMNETNQGLNNKSRNSSINKGISKDSLKKNSNEKTKRSLINPIPLNKISNTDISQKKNISKLNSSKTINSNSLLNSAEIREDILSNVSNLNSNRNSNKQIKKNYINLNINSNGNHNLNNSNNPVVISQTSKMINNINVQKFINSSNPANSNFNNFNNNGNNKYSNYTNAYEKTEEKNRAIKNLYFNPDDISKEIYKKIDNIVDIKKFISEKDTKMQIIEQQGNAGNKHRKSNLTGEKNDSLRMEYNKESVNNSKDRILSNPIFKERSPSLLKKARMERKIQKNNDYLDLDNSIKKKESSNLNRSSNSKYMNEKSEISSNKFNNESSRFHSTNKQKKNSFSKISSTSDQNLNNFNYLKNHFNSYKNKKLENKMTRKGSNISKHSVDFVNEYISQKKFKEKNKDEFENNSATKELIGSMASNDMKNNILSIKNCDIDFDNLEFYDKNPRHEIKAVFIHNNNNKESKEQYENQPEKIQVKKFLSSNKLNNEFTSKFLSNQ